MSRNDAEMSLFAGHREGQIGGGHGGSLLRRDPLSDVPGVPAKCPPELSRRLETFEDVNAVLVYEPDTGLLRWRVDASPRRPAGKAVSLRTTGTYIVLNVGGYAYKVHRLAWLLHTGRWPQFEIDHINGNRADNRIANLRDVPHQVNQMNQACHRAALHSPSPLAPARVFAQGA